MKNETAVIYSSRTGNTKRVAEHLAEALGASCHSVADASAVSEEATLCIGTWIDRGTADAAARHPDAADFARVIAAAREVLA